MLRLVEQMRVGNLIQVKAQTGSLGSGTTDTTVCPCCTGFLSSYIKT